MIFKVGKKMRYLIMYSSEKGEKIAIFLVSDEKSEIGGLEKRDVIK